MSHVPTMDPDIPVASIEQPEGHPLHQTNSFTSYRESNGTPGILSSPNITPFKTPLSHPATPGPSKSPRSSSISRNGTRSTPNLELKRSSSSLSVSRGQTPSKTQLRRVSSNLNPASPASPASRSTSPMPPANAFRPPMTAESVAQDFFQRELDFHSRAQSSTAVIIHDSCYGHRFSRPRTSKAALSTIVERPERIHATILGASTAYVRLGERHTEGAHGPHPDKRVETLPDPPFVLKKTSRSVALNHPAVTHVHGTKWMEELQIMCDSAESKLAINGKELQRPIGYGKDENGNHLPKLHEGDLYLCSESLAALQGCLGGVCDAVDTVFSPSITQRAFVCIRPPGHHCSSNYPSGFCWLNNVHVGISYAAMTHGLTHAAIIDFDLHHGDGSQTITWDHNSKAQLLPKTAAQHKKTPIGYYSLHDINSYPCEWGDEEKVKNASVCIDNAHGQSIWNVHLQSWKSLDHFWQLYETKYKVLLEKAEKFLEHHSERLRGAGIRPQAAIFLSAGFDASQWEGQGMQRHNVNVPTEFYAKLTSDVVRLASCPGLGVDGRVISVLEGGYSDRALMSGVLSHLCGLTGEPTETNIPTIKHGNETYQLHTDTPAAQRPDPEQLPYHSAWWHEANLESLEARVAGKIPPPLTKKDKAAGNYSSPTQASTARMTDVARERRSLSAQLETRLFLESVEPSPPPPVDWITAAYELSRILIPSDRQTLSCRHDELNAEATKARRERQSAIGVAPAEPRMQLRTRGKGPTVEPEAVRAASRTSNRRTTIAAVSELPDPSMPQQRTRRRSSAASSILSSFQDMKLDQGSTATTMQNNTPQQDLITPMQGQELVAKKTRMGPPSKKTALRLSSPKKARDSTQIANKSKMPPDQSASASRGATTIEPPGSTLPKVGKSEMAADSDGLDGLTAGMKKVSIKLKMPTPEQHADNQRKVEESAKLKKPRGTRKPLEPKAIRPKIGSTPGLTNTWTPAEATEDKGQASATQTAVINDAPNAMGSESTVNSQSHSTVASLPSMNTVLGGGDIDMSSRADTSDALPGGVERIQGAGSMKTKADLPVFTSSSPIPFAAAQRLTETESSRD